MSPAARSILVYSVYLFGLGAALLFVPNVPLPIFGLAEAHEVWIRVLGMTVIFFSSFYFVASRNEYRELFRASVLTRIAVPFVFASFVVAGFAPWNLLLLTPPDILFALWTASALRNVAAHGRLPRGRTMGSPQRQAPRGLITQNKPVVTMQSYDCCTSARRPRTTLHCPSLLSSRGHYAWIKRPSSWPCWSRTSRSSASPRSRCFDVARPATSVP